MSSLLVLIIVSAFVFYKLFKILGDTKYDNDSNEETRKIFEDLKRNIVQEAKEKESGQQIDIASGLEASLSEAERGVFETLRKTDNAITADKFIAGAKKAFEIVNNAYSAIDLGTLENFLAPPLYDRFLNEIQKLKNTGQTLHLTLVGIQRADIEKATIEEDVAYITVGFSSEQILYITNASGELIKGSATRVKPIAGSWTFAKNVKSTSKIWKLYEITDK